jgi:S-adenosylmethionine:tRNA ribosyltransferase-isomerase
MIMPPVHMSQYSYELTDSFIAQYPLEKRDESKLLIYKHPEIKHGVFKMLAEHLPENSLLVFNNTKVIPARMHFSRDSGAVIEIFLMESLEPSLMLQAFSSKSSCVWHCTIGNKKKWKEEEILFLKTEQFELKAELIDKEKNHVRFSWEADMNFGEVIDLCGKIPLPPYMNRAAEEKDKERYQTLFAKEKGAVAAPTASLHFTDNVMYSLAQAGHKHTFCTLHVGSGTFMPVKVENALDHPMHAEKMVLNYAFITDLLAHTGPIIPAGTTAMRTLESLYWYGVKLSKNAASDFFIEKLFPYTDAPATLSLSEALIAVKNHMDLHQLQEISGSTEIMIMPGYDFKVCSGIITNFHQPQSTLLLLIAALVGEKNWKNIYQEAKNQQYRFLSYGDSSLLMKV